MKKFRGRKGGQRKKQDPDWPKLEKEAHALSKKKKKKKGLPQFRKRKKEFAPRRRTDLIKKAI